MNHNTIPEDIAEIATYLAGEIQDDGSWSGCRVIVAEAILAERQRSERTIRELEYQIKMAEFKE